MFAALLMSLTVVSGLAGIVQLATWLREAVPWWLGYTWRKAGSSSRRLAALVGSGTKSEHRFEPDFVVGVHVFDKVDTPGGGGAIVGDIVASRLDVPLYLITVERRKDENGATTHDVLSWPKAGAEDDKETAPSTSSSPPRILLVDDTAFGANTLSYCCRKLRKKYAGATVKTGVLVKHKNPAHGFPVPVNYFVHETRRDRIYMPWGLQRPT